MTPVTAAAKAAFAYNAIINGIRKSLSDEQREMVDKTTKPGTGPEKIMAFQKGVKRLSKMIEKRRRLLAFSSEEETNKYPLANLASASCLCEAYKAAYLKNDCENVPEITNGVDEKTLVCTQLWQNIKSEEEASVCPVDPKEGTCGIPVNLDLFGKKFMNGIEVVRQTSGSADPAAITFKLDSDEEGANVFKEWLETTARKDIKAENGKFVWNGEIPEDVGAFLRRSCGSLKWSAETNGARIEFDGLTFRAAGGGRRRRLLQQRRGSC